MSYRVYRYTFPDGKIYIGVTKNSIATRRDQGYQHNKSLRDAIKEIGFKNIKVDILADYFEQEEAFRLEEYFIAKYKADDPKHGYNISKGGKSTFKGLHHTEEHKQYMRDKLRGIQFSEEHIEHLKESHKKERIPVVCFRPYGGEPKYYESLGSAAESINGYKSNISRACNNGKLYKGFYWRRVKKEVM